MDEPPQEPPRDLFGDEPGEPVDDSPRERLDAPGPPSRPVEEEEPESLVDAEHATEEHPHEPWDEDASEHSSDADAEPVREPWNEPVAAHSPDRDHDDDLEHSHEHEHSDESEHSHEHELGEEQHEYSADLLDDPAWQLPPADELLDDLGEHIHTPAELAERRALERAERRRAGRQRLLVLVAGLIVVIAIVIIVVVVGGGGKKAPPVSSKAASKAAAVGTGPSYLFSTIASSTNLTSNVVIADRDNNRVLAVTPTGQIVWQESATAPSDAFLSSTGLGVIITEHARAVVLIKGVNSGRVDYTYGRGNGPGSGPGRLHDPQTGHISGGSVVIADLGNCRILTVKKGSHIADRIFGSPGSCVHAPPTSFANPVAAFPTADGRIVVTERAPSWIDVLTSNGTVLHTVRLANLAKPSDANEFAPNEVIVTDRTRHGSIEELAEDTGKVLWKYPQTGASALNLPTMALVLPNNDVLVSDTGNDRVIVIDHATQKIVWQFGKGSAGSAPGYLHAPGSINLVQTSG
jgi:PQQ-like domain